ncbi:MAG: lipocalin-like domain-containing protein [Bacteroidota bacterium]
MRYKSFLFLLILLLSACAPRTAPSASLQMPQMQSIGTQVPSGFTVADGTRPLIFPRDFGAHEDFRTEWWYYTGNLQTPEGRPFGFELTIFRVGLLPPSVQIPSGSNWYGRSIYFAHFALSDIQKDTFHAFERYSRPGPGLAGAQGQPYHVWLEDWKITEQTPGVYRLQAEQEGIAIDLTLTDETGVILHGEAGYSRKGQDPANASYYYSQPRLRAKGTVQLEKEKYSVNGLAWNDHEFSTSVLDKDQIGWDWFSFQFEGGRALMLYQLRERSGKISDASSGTFIDTLGKSHPIDRSGFEITVQDEWKSPHTQAVYPAAWQVRLQQPDCLLQARPRMADQEIHFPAVTYWEGAVHFEGTCDGKPVRGNGYIELTGYGGKLPLP